MSLICRHIDLAILHKAVYFYPGKFKFSVGQVWIFWFKQVVLISMVTLHGYLHCSRFQSGLESTNPNWTNQRWAKSDDSEASSMIATNNLRLLASPWQTQGRGLHYSPLWTTSLFNFFAIMFLNLGFLSIIKKKISKYVFWLTLSFYRFTVLQ